MASAGAELSLLETELTEALEECIDANFEESESRFDVKHDVLSPTVTLAA